MTPILLARRSDVGRVRTRNEDTVRLHRNPHLVVVADGMGGHPGGDVASAVAAEGAEEWLRTRWPLDPATRDLPEERGKQAFTALLAEAVEEAHRAVRRRGHGRPELQGMGTTLTALALDEGAGRWALGHVGDSRAYLLRDGSLSRLTRDDTWVQEQIDAGRLDPEQAWRHPSGHVLTQAVGLDPGPEPSSATGLLRPGDRFLLASDGLTDMVSEDRIRELLAAESPLEEVAPRLLEAALEAGGEDNVSLGLAQVVP